MVEDEVGAFFKDEKYEEKNNENVLNVKFSAIV